MTVSMKVMSAGDGYMYLLRSVVAGDGDRALTTPLTRYYAESGTPPGRWLGSAVGRLGDGRLTAGDQVTESQLGLLIGQGRDPITGEQLGRAYPVYKSTEERVADRVRELDTDLSVQQHATEMARIEAEETAVSGRRPVAGFDFTFSVPKSVSVLWGVAGANLQEMIVEAHHTAVAEVIGFLEREIAATRTGVAAGDGAVAQVAVHGVSAVAYDHWDSRAGDPQLHTHVVISNKVQTVLDGRWRSLDGRPIHACVTALAAYYDAVLADRLTATFGFGWEQRLRRRNMHPHAEITGVPEALIAEFSSRTRDIDREAERMIEAYVANHGRQPSDALRIRMRAQATVETRPEKQVRSLADLTADWRGRAVVVMGEDPTAWARTLAASGTPASISPDQITPDRIADLAAQVVTAVGRKCSTWRHWNLWAEASRQTALWRFATIEQRERFVAQIVEAAERRSVRLTPPELAPSPPEFQREDGTSVFRPRHAEVYSSQEILAAEDRLLARADDLTAPRVRAAVVDRVARRVHEGYRLTTAQAEALEEIATSGRQVDVLVGPAGAGKTTAMYALRRAWETQYGRRSVIGLAPSAAAAAVLAADLNIPCENTAMWLTQHAHGYTRFDPGQLVIVDEASLADTTTLDRLTALAAEAGAKVLLVGDWAQLQSIDAGGAFSMLAHARPDVAELTDIHRFTHDWEKSASLDLRSAQPESIATYARHHRLRDGTTEEMLEIAYEAWKRDTEEGRASILVAESTEFVRSLNARARADRILHGTTDAPRETALSDSTYASPGDTVITRRNDRSLRTSGGMWVRNGDLWRVKATRRNGSLLVHAPGHPHATVVLPPEYVAIDVELGYAITAHRAQGVTVETAHVLASSRMTRESLYVAMTRGRDDNTAYVALDQPDESHAAPIADGELTANSVLQGVLRHTGTELSAHEAITTEQAAASSIAQLAAEYDTLASAAQRPRWKVLVRRSDLTKEQAEAVIASDAFGSLTATLRRAEATGHEVDKILPDLVRRRRLNDAEDPAAVLQHRLHLATAGHGGGEQHFIAGLIPEACGSMPGAMRAALDQRRDLIEARAHDLADEATHRGPSWLRGLGRPPTDAVLRARWLREITVVLAYRDRYQIRSDLVLGFGAASAVQKMDAARAEAAYRRAATIAQEAEHCARGLGHATAFAR
ncbi:MobF family relaxase [Nocardioides sp. NPDC000445]|uniref:MobF family relaxase n=1 Tax=Nocardioides sp. NPDC000445 TaxID=3154257 RepID=UPI00332CC87E